MNNCGQGKSLTVKNMICGRDDAVFDRTDHTGTYT